MIIKKYIANTVEEAQSLIDQELGEKAMILTSRYVQQRGWRALFAVNKVEVTAAIEEDDLQAYNRHKLGDDKDSPLNSNLEELKRSLENTKDEKETTPAPASAPTYSDPRFQKHTQEQEPEEDQERALRKLQSLRRQLPGPKEEKPKPTKNVEKELADLLGAARQFSGSIDDVKEKPQLSEAAVSLDNLRKVIREEITRAQQGSAIVDDDDVDDEPVGGVRFLVNKGIDRSIAKTIEKSLDARFGAIDMRVQDSQRTVRLNALRGEIAKLLQTTGPLTLSRGRPTLAALVGPTGVGKTTTLMKIAAYHAQILDKKVAVISIDSEKMGARDQIKELTLKFGMPLTVVRNKKELSDAVTLYRSYDLILIDTSGRSQYDRTQIEELADTLSILPALQGFLTISATTKDVDAYGIIERFSCMPVRSLIVTKLDETIADGLLVNVCVKKNMPISYVTYGQRIPGDLKIADANEIAKELLVQHNAAEFDTIRQLVNS